MDYAAMYARLRALPMLVILPLILAFLIWLDRKLYKDGVARTNPIVFLLLNAFMVVFGALGTWHLWNIFTNANDAHAQGATELAYSPFGYWGR